MSLYVNPEGNSPSVAIQFNGFQIDLFETETGSLGMTIEMADGENNGDNDYIDLFVSRGGLTVTGDFFTPKGEES